MSLGMHSNRQLLVLFASLFSLPTVVESRGSSDAEEAEPDDVDVASAVSSQDDDASKK